MTDPTLKINEIYKSIQGESSHAGLPCIFIRLSACDLRCSYCDTTYAFFEGSPMTLDDILRRVEELNCPLVEVTGGEPLLQKNVLPLMSRLCDAGHTVLLETSGAHDISAVDPRVIRIMDLKTPDSGESGKNRLTNLAHLRPGDEIKFVIGSQRDYEWAKEMIRAHRLDEKAGALLFSPVFRQKGMEGQTQGHEGLDPRKLADWILADGLAVRFQLQLHKHVWEPTKRGV